PDTQHSPERTADEEQNAGRHADLADLPAPRAPEQRYVPERERAHRHDSGGADEERAEGTPTLQNEAHRIAERRFALLGRAEPAQDLILPLRLADGEHQTGKDEAWQTHEQKAHLPSGKIADARHMKRRQGAD